MKPKTPENKQISIDGKFISGYKYIVLSQRINDHHSFEIGIDLEEGETVAAHTLDKSKNWLGKTVIINTTGKDFTGIVTDISLNQNNGNHGQITVAGYSSTIVLEDGEAMRSWLEKPLSDIIKDATKHPKVTAKIAPESTAAIAYESQYLETNFKFVQRIAKQHNEWLYYDGDTLFFGKPKSPSPIKIEYGKDLYEMNIGIQAQARKMQAFSYKSADAQQHNGQSPDSPAGLNELGQHAFNASLETFGTGGNGYTTARVQNKSDIDKYLKKKQQSAAAASNVISGKSTKRGLTVGSVIDLETAIAEEAGAYTNKKHGKYIITEITHYAKGANYYTNSFTALPAGIKTLPEPNVDLPVAQTQMATVLDNKDPKKKGRVQVQMNWQTGAMKSDWIRVMTPDAGSSDNVGTNRGFVFIPEKGDQVLLGFRYNDPNRPFVMGSLFNGQTAAGGQDQNKTKSIITRSGSSITFDDNEEKGNIVVKDGAGNTVTLNGKDTVSVSANATISLSTGESSITLKSDGTINITGKNIAVSGSKTTSMATESSTFNTEKEKTSVNGKEIKVNATQTVSVNGQSKATLSSSATTSVEGTIVKLN